MGPDSRNLFSLILTPEALVNRASATCQVAWPDRTPARSGSDTPFANHDVWIAFGRGLYFPPRGRPARVMLMRQDGAELHELTKRSSLDLYIRANQGQSPELLSMGSGSRLSGLDPPTAEQKAADND